MNITLPDLSRLQALRAHSAETSETLSTYRSRLSTLTDRHANGTAPQAVSAFNLFQTPPQIAARLLHMLKPQSGESLLEPSAGLGRLLSEAEPYGLALTAIEFAPQCSRCLSFRFPNATHLQRDFLTVSPSETGLFDMVAMNPPFHMRADIDHVFHALSFLKPGGRLAAICMDTPHRQEAFRGRGFQWHSLPANAFAKEGTKVSTAIITVTN